MLPPVTSVLHIIKGLGPGGAEELLEMTVEYLQTRIRHDRGCHCDNCSWLREARRFLHNRHD